MDGHANSSQFDTKVTSGGWGPDSLPPSSGTSISRVNPYSSEPFGGRAAYFYPTSEPSGDSLSSPSPDSSSYGSSSTTACIIAKAKSSVPDKLERRREQNRSSQRAYRERRERQQRELEAQIIRWQQEHSNLLQMYNQQMDELIRSRAIIQHLQGGIFRMQNAIRNPACGCIPRPQVDGSLDPFFAMDPADKMLLQQQHQQQQLPHQQPPQYTSYTRMYNEQ